MTCKLHYFSYLRKWKNLFWFHSPHQLPLQFLYLFAEKLHRFSTSVVTSYVLILRQPLSRSPMRFTLLTPVVYFTLHLTNLMFVHLVTLSSFFQEVVLEHHTLFFLLCWFFFLSLTSSVCFRVQSLVHYLHFLLVMSSSSTILITIDI